MYSGPKPSMLLLCKLLKSEREKGLFLTTDESKKVINSSVAVLKDMDLPKIPTEHSASTIHMLSTFNLWSTYKKIIYPFPEEYTSILEKKGPKYEQFMKFLSGDNLPSCYKNIMGMDQSKLYETLFKNVRDTVIVEKIDVVISSGGVWPYSDGKLSTNLLSDTKAPIIVDSINKLIPVFTENGIMDVASEIYPSFLNKSTKSQNGKFETTELLIEQLKKKIPFQYRKNIIRFVYSDDFKESELFENVYKLSNDIYKSKRYVSFGAESVVSSYPSYFSKFSTIDELLEQGIGYEQMLYCLSDKTNNGMKGYLDRIKEFVTGQTSKHYHVFFCGYLSVPMTNLIETWKGGHSNVLILDKEKKKAIYFEPHGSGENAVGWNTSLPYVFKHYLNSLDSTWTFEPDENTVYTNWQTSDSSCQTWSFLFSIMYILNKDMDVMDFYEILYEDEKLRYLVVLIFTFYICQHVNYDMLTPEGLTYGEAMDHVNVLLTLSDIKSS